MISICGSNIWNVLYEISIYRNCVGDTSPIKIHISQQNLSSQWLLLCVNLFPGYCKKSLFISVSSDFYEKDIVTHDYCVSTHNSLCSLENCKFHLILIGISLSQFCQRLDKYVYIFQEVDCLFILFKHRFFSSIVTSNREMFNELSRAVQHNLRWKGAKKMPSIAKKRLIRKKFRRHYLCSNQKLASKKTLGSAFLDRIRKNQNSKDDSDLFKIIDCFIDCHGSVHSA